jgi:hypothetical protein
MLFIIEQHKQVEPLYESFVEGQLLKAGQMLGDIWFSAWQQAPVDTYLKGQLARRKH